MLKGWICCPPHPVSVDEVLQLVGYNHHRAFVVLQELEDPLLQQVIAEVYVQRREGVVLEGQGCDWLTSLVNKVG